MVFCSIYKCTRVTFEASNYMKVYLRLWLIEKTKKNEYMEQYKTHLTIFSNYLKIKKYIYVFIYTFY